MVKDIHRTIKQKWFQFVAIVLITALGVGFFVGIRVTGHNMRITADKYMITSDAPNLVYRHTLGIDQAMLDELSSIVKGQAIGIHEGDAFVREGDFEGVMHIVDYNGKTAEDLTLIDGVMPRTDGEIVLDDVMHRRYDLKIGDEIAVLNNDIFEASTVRVVGLVKSNLYMNLERGNTSLGTGKVSGFMYAKGLKLKNDVFTSARFSVNDVEQAQVQLKESDARISQNRYERIINPIQTTLDDNQRKLNAQRLRADASFKEAQSKLNAGQLKLQDGHSELQSGLNEVANALNIQFGAQSNATKLETLHTLTENIATQDLPKLEASMQTLDQALEALKLQQQQLQEAIKLETDGAKLAQYQKDLQSGSVQLATQTALRAGVHDKFVEVSANVIRLRATLIKLEEGMRAYESGMALYQTNYATFIKQKDATYVALDEGQAKIDEGVSALAKIDKGFGVIQNREDLVVGYKDYYQDSERIERIGDIFPLLFFGVAIFVMLSTITRMVDDQRMESGVYKALGYSWQYVSLKATGFAFFSWILGSLVGVAIGFYFIPVIIYNSYRIIYQTPDLITPFVVSYAWFPLVLSFASSVGIAWFKTMKVSREKTASLMKPPVPKGGQRILLERIPFVWNRLGFLRKVSFRNLFRNKVRFMMTFIGIGGCAGLLITGFGMNHSLYSITDKQFHDIIRYDGLVSFYDTIDVQDVPLDQTIFLEAKSLNYEGSDVVIYAFEDTTNLGSWVSMDTPQGETIHLEDNQVVVTEKFATTHNLKAGSTLSLLIAHRMVDFKVQGVVKNYAHHYIYMSQKTYAQATGEAIKENVMFFKSKEDTESISKTLLQQSNVYAVSSIREVEATFKDTMGSIDVVIYVVVGAAFILELVVLLNLISMNMSERTKELATLKVLGFLPNELSAYIMRETIIQGVISLIFGGIFGKILHYFVITSAETNAIMFNRELLPSTIFLGLAMTFAFALVINYLMSKRANKVNMSEALKTFDQ